MENTRIINYKCPSCGGNVLFGADGITGKCQSCGQEVQKERSVTLNFATHTDTDSFSRAYRCEEGKFNIELSDASLNLDMNQYKVLHTDFVGAAVKDLSPEDMVKVDGYIKKINYGFNNPVDFGIIELTECIRAIDPENIYVVFLNSYVNRRANWPNSLMRKDALEISGFLLPYITHAPKIGCSQLSHSGISRIVNFVMACQIGNDEKLDVISTVLHDYSCTPITTFNTAVSVLAALVELTNNGDAKFKKKCGELVAFYVDKYVKLNSAKQLATFAEYYKENLPDLSLRLTDRLVSVDNIGTDFGVIDLKSATNYLSECSNLTEELRVEFSVRLTELWLAHDTTLFVETDAIELMLVVRALKIPDKKKLPLYELAMKKIGQRRKLLFDRHYTDPETTNETDEIAAYDTAKLCLPEELSGTPDDGIWTMVKPIIYMAKSDFPTEIKKLFIDKLLCPLHKPEDLFDAVTAMLETDYPEKKAVAFRYLRLSVSISRFEEAVKYFGFIYNLPLESAERNNLYIYLLEHNVKNKVTQIYGYISLYSYIDDAAMRFKYLLALFAINRKDLFMRSTQFELLYKGGDMNSDEFLLACDSMKKFILSSVTDAAEKRALGEIDAIIKENGITDYSEEIAAKHAKYIRWLRGKRYHAYDDAKDKILEQLIVQNAEKLDDNRYAVSNITSAKRSLAIFTPPVLLLTLLDIAGAVLLFTKFNEAWFFGVPQGVRVIVDIVWVTLNAVLFALTLLFCNGKLNAKYERNRLILLCSTVVGTLLMFSVFIASYVVMNNRVHEVNNSSTFYNINYMPYSSYRLTSNIRIDADDELNNFRGDLDLNGYTISSKNTGAGLWSGYTYSGTKEKYSNGFLAYKCSGTVHDGKIEGFPLVVYKTKKTGQFKNVEFSFTNLDLKNKPILLIAYAEKNRKTNQYENCLLRIQGCQGVYANATLDMIITDSTVYGANVTSYEIDYRLYGYGYLFCRGGSRRSFSDYRDSRKHDARSYTITISDCDFYFSNVYDDYRGNGSYYGNFAFENYLYNGDKLYLSITDCNYICSKNVRDGHIVFSATYSDGDYKNYKSVSMYHKKENSDEIYLIEEIIISENEKSATATSSLTGEDAIYRK